MEERWWQDVESTFEVRGRVVRARGSLHPNETIVHMKTFGIVRVHRAPARVGAGRISPLSFECRSDTFADSVTVSPDREAAVFAWSDTAIEPMRVRLVAPDSTLAVPEGNGCVRLSSPSGALLVCVEPHGADIRAFVEDGIRLDVSARGGTLRLVMVATDRDGASSRAAAMVRDPDMIPRARAAWLSRLHGTGLSVRSAACGLDVALLHARAVLSLTAPTPSPASEAIWPILGALATGDFATAREWMGNITPAASRFEKALHIVCAARSLAWSGERDGAARLWPRIGALLDELTEPNDALVHDDASALIAALTEGAVMAETLGDSDRHRILESRARQIRVALQHGDGPLQLQLAWPSLADGLVEGVKRLATVRSFESVREAGGLAGAVVFGLLGVTADEARNRIGLRPRLSSELFPFEVERLRVGASEFRLAAVCNGRTLRFSVEQTAGAVPARLIFEPIVSAPAIEEVRIDGQPAALALRPAHAGWSVPVQLTLDHERTLEVDVPST